MCLCVCVCVCVLPKRRYFTNPVDVRWTVARYSASTGTRCLARITSDACLFFHDRAKSDPHVIEPTISCQPGPVGRHQKIRSSECAMPGLPHECRSGVNSGVRVWMCAPITVEAQALDSAVQQQQPKTRPSLSTSTGQAAALALPRCERRRRAFV